MYCIIISINIPKILDWLSDVFLAGRMTQKLQVNRLPVQKYPLVSVNLSEPSVRLHR